MTPSDVRHNAHMASNPLLTYSYCLSKMGAICPEVVAKVRGTGVATRNHRRRRSMLNLGSFLVKLFNAHQRGWAARAGHSPCQIRVRFAVQRSPRRTAPPFADISTAFGTSKTSLSAPSWG